jgi:hypothetical protein
MSTKTRWVSDDVWAQLDPRAGAVERAAARRYVRLGVLAALVLAAAGTVWTSGLAWAHVERPWAEGFAQKADPVARTITTDFVIKNDGWRAIGIEDIGADGPGLRVLRTGHPLVNADDWRTVPFWLKPGETATLSITYQITDCAAVTSGEFAIPVRVHRFWGTQTVDITLPRAYREVSPHIASPVGPEWQRDLADQACGGHS